MLSAWVMGVELFVMSESVQHLGERCNRQSGFYCYKCVTKHEGNERSEAAETTQATDK